MSALSEGYAENIKTAKMDYLQQRTIPNVRDAYLNGQFKYTISLVISLEKARKYQTCTA